MYNYIVLYEQSGSLLINTHVDVTTQGSPPSMGPETGRLQDLQGPEDPRDVGCYEQLCQKQQELARALHAIHQQQAWSFRFTERKEVFQKKPLILKFRKDCVTQKNLKIFS